VLPPEAKSAFAEFLLALRLYVVPDDQLDALGNIGRSRYDVRGIAEMMAVLATRKEVVLEKVSSNSKVACEGPIVLDDDDGTCSFADDCFCVEPGCDVPKSCEQLFLYDPAIVEVRHNDVTVAVLDALGQPPSPEAMPACCIQVVTTPLYFIVVDKSADDLVQVQNQTIALLMNMLNSSCGHEVLEQAAVALPDSAVIEPCADVDVVGVEQDVCHEDEWLDLPKNSPPVLNCGGLVRFYENGCFLSGLDLGAVATVSQNCLGNVYGWLCMLSCDERCQIRDFWIRAESCSVSEVLPPQPCLQPFPLQHEMKKYRFRQAPLAPTSGAAGAPTSCGPRHGLS
jgi:hypothetical protein